MSLYCMINGACLPEDEAVISINNRSFRYGDGCFETIQFHSEKIQLAPYHFRRLFAALQTLQFQVPHFFTDAFLVNQVEQLLKRNNHQTTARIRLTIFAGDGAPDNSRELNWLLQSWPLSKVTNTAVEAFEIGCYEKGFKAADGLANIKSNNYLIYSQAAWYARQNNWQEAIVLNHYGRVADTSISNLFLIKNGVIFTPPLSEGPVAGVMRQYLLEVLPAMGYSVFEKPLELTEIESADELFLTNALRIRMVSTYKKIHYGNRLAASLIAHLNQAGIQLH